MKDTLNEEIELSEKRKAYIEQKLGQEVVTDPYNMIKQDMQCSIDINKRSMIR